MPSRRMESRELVWRFLPRWLQSRGLALRYRWLGWVLIVVLVAPLLFNWLLSLTRTR